MPIMSGDTPEHPEFSDETLVGYLMGGLSEEEAASIDAALAGSEVLRQRLRDLRGLFEPLGESQETFEPRAQLVDETLAWIAQQSDTVEPVREFSDEARLDWSEVPVSTRIAWMDSIVAVAAGIIFLSFLLPTVWQWREAARQFACAENLRNVGFGLLSYVNLSSSRQIPPIDVSGPMTFAGMYAIHLRDRELLESAGWVQCPSNRPVSTLSFIPTSQQFLSATPEQQRILSYLVGGNYAYNLGFLIDGKYQTPRLDAPVRFAVLGDMWPSTYGVVEQAEQPPILHGDRAANMLFNDGSIRRIRLPCSSRAGAFSNDSIDNPFLNSELEQGVGIGIDDACLGPSYWRPAVDIDRVK
ncbi:MAG: hypothetical protein ACK553_00495 [Planctomycetota bacterium]|jgi:prepilin-type processing-associated H-X9-DG protein